MLLSLVLLLTSSLLAAGDDLISDANPCEGTPSAKKQYDYFTFAQQWYPNVCKSNRDCKKLSINRWTIHGLWPDSKDSQPAFCTPQNFAVPGKIKDEMARYWPSFYNDYKNTDFWKYEYCKHGACCTDQLHTIYDYFSKALNFNKNQYNLDRALKSAGIGPSSTDPYNFALLDKAVKDRFRVTAGYQCRSVGGKQLVAEIQLRINKHLSHIEDFEDQKENRIPFEWDSNAFVSCDKRRPFYLLPSSSQEEPGNSVRDEFEPGTSGQEEPETSGRDEL